MNNSMNKIVNFLKNSGYTEDITKIQYILTYEKLPEDIDLIVNLEYLIIKSKCYYTKNIFEYILPYRLKFLNLKKFVARGIGIYELPDFKHLVYLNVYGNHIKNISIDCPMLKYMDISNNKIEMITGEYPNLITLLCGNNKINNLPNLPKVLHLECYSNPLNTLPFINEGITFLDISFTFIKTIPFNLSKLKILHHIGIKLDQFNNYKSVKIFKDFYTFNEPYIVHKSVDDKNEDDKNGENKFILKKIYENMPCLVRKLNENWQNDVIDENDIKFVPE